MSFKKSVMKMEKEFEQNFTELNASFYISKRNMCIHMRLEQSIFLYKNYAQLIA